MQSKLEQLQATILDKCSTSHFDNDETFYVKIVALNEIYNFLVLSFFSFEFIKMLK